MTARKDILDYIKSNGEVEMIRKYPQKIEDLFDQIAPWSEYDKAKLEWKLKADAPSEIVEAREKLNRALE